MLLTKEDVLLAQQGLKILQARLKRWPKTKRARLIVDAGTTAEIALPPQAVQALAEALGHLAAGQDVTVTALPQEMTTQQAAEYLHVSRLFLISLLEKNELPYRKVGTHRRVLAADVIAYKNRIDAARLQTLEQLAAQAQELGMGY
ncbi:MAG: helix-turn-helix domain-containing protein [Blastocatellia bacterium]|nr:helix-turn-helix domain-containing protein [Blastocatellia bacterium]